MIRRSAFTAVGGWDKHLGRGLKTRTCSSDSRSTDRSTRSQERLVRHRRHAGQSSDTPGRHDSQIIKLHARWRDLSRLRPEQRPIVRDAWRFYDRQLTWHTAAAAATRLVRAGHPARSLRFLGGGVFRVAESWVRPRPR